jgi:phosphopantothenoylcysteine decarboxylase/phosphopantothenate--cysteine ligase
MNVNMYEHPQTQANIATLSARGVAFVTPESGDLACGWNGRGRLAKPQEIYHHVIKAMTPQDLAGKRVLISTGPTREAIDPVRFITNRSSGKMGLALAFEASRRGADVTLVEGPLLGSPYIPAAIKRVRVTSAQEMREAVLDQVESAANPDIVIMAAAVADYRPENASQEKIKKANATLSISLTPNADILREVGERKRGGQSPFLVGFAVETGDTETLLSEARRKLADKNADLLVGNLAKDSFDKDTNRVVIVSTNGEAREVATAKKSFIARTIFDTISAAISND